MVVMQEEEKKMKCEKGARPTAPLGPRNPVKAEIQCESGDGRENKIVKAEVSTATQRVEWNEDGRKYIKKRCKRTKEVRMETDAKKCTGVDPSTPDKQEKTKNTEMR